MDHPIVVKTCYRGEHLFVVSKTEWDSFNPHLTETTQYYVDNVVFNLHTLYHTATIIDPCAEAVIQFITQHGNCTPLIYLRNFVSFHHRTKTVLEQHRVFQIKSLTHVVIPAFLSTVDILSLQRTSRLFRDVKHHTFIMTHPQPTIPVSIRCLQINFGALTDLISFSPCVTGLEVVCIDFRKHPLDPLCNVGRANITAIAQLIRTNPTLTTVEIDGLFLRSEQGPMFSELIAALLDLPCLTHLRYNSNIPIRLSSLNLTDLTTAYVESIESVTGLTTLNCLVDNQEEATKLTQILVNNPGLRHLQITSTDEGMNDDVIIDWPMLRHVETLLVGKGLQVNLDQFPRVSHFDMGRLHQVSQSQLAHITAITIHTQEDYDVVKHLSLDYMEVDVTDNLVLTNDCRVRSLSVTIYNSCILDYPSPHIESLNVMAYATVGLPGSQTLKRLTIGAHRDAAVMVTGSYLRVTHLHIEANKITICRDFEDVFPSLQSLTYSTEFVAHLKDNKRLRDNLVRLGHLGEYYSCGDHNRVG